MFVDPESSLMVIAKGPEIAGLAAKACDPDDHANQAKVDAKSLIAIPVSRRPGVSLKVVAGDRSSGPEHLWQLLFISS